MKISGKKFRGFYCNKSGTFILFVFINYALAHILAVIVIVVWGGLSVKFLLPFCTRCAGKMAPGNVGQRYNVGCTASAVMIYGR
jgi:hypothetical protein